MNQKDSRRSHIRRKSSPINEHTRDQKNESSQKFIHQDSHFRRRYSTSNYQNDLVSQCPQLDTANLRPGGAQYTLEQPMIQNIAMQYGQHLAYAGTRRVKQEVEKFFLLSKLKYYFAVDASYVLHKLLLLVFPFLHADWSIKFASNNKPVQPKFDINAPDLYIPIMGFGTYIFLTILVLGLQGRFMPCQINNFVTSTLVCCLAELLIYACALIIMHIHTNLATLDFLAYSGYKFVGIVLTILNYLIFGNIGYFISLIYTNIALGFFLVRSLKVQILTTWIKEQNDEHQLLSGKKRRQYFLLFVAGMQPILSFWLSFHILYNNDANLI